MIIKKACIRVRTFCVYYTVYGSDKSINTIYLLCLLHYIYYFIS